MLTPERIPDEVRPFGAVADVPKRHSWITFGLAALACAGCFDDTGVEVVQSGGGGVVAVDYPGGDSYDPYGPGGPGGAVGDGGNGKDHWPITSMMVMSQAIDGNRIVGKTDYGQQPYLLDPVDLRPMRLADGDEGRMGRDGEVDANAPVRLTPEHVHVALRKLAGIERDALSMEQFPLRGGALELPILQLGPGQRPPEQQPEEAPI